MLRHGDLELHRIEHKVTRGGRTIDLTAKEFSLLEYLLLHQGECVSRSQLLAEVWQMPEETGTNVVDVYVNYLRRKVEDGAATMRDARTDRDGARGRATGWAAWAKKPVVRHPGAVVRRLAQRCVCLAAMGEQSRSIPSNRNQSRSRAREVRWDMDWAEQSIESKAAMRTVVLASADAHFRARLRQQLTAMRWQVREAAGGAEAMAQLESEVRGGHGAGQRAARSGGG